MSKKKIIAAIKSSKRILISSHINPDGDAIGSEMAMALALRQMGKDVVISNKDVTPSEYCFLIQSESIFPPDKVTGEFDLMIALDCGHFDRVGAFKIENFKLIVNIDHHSTNNSFGHINWYRDSASSTSELVYELLCDMPVTITPQIATCVYAGLLTDTGSFRYSNTNSKTFRIAAKLIEDGVNPATVASEIYESTAISKIRLLGESLQTLEFFGSGVIASMAVTLKMMGRTEAKSSDTEEFINYPRGLKGVKVAIFWRQVEDDLYKVSFRSKSNVDINVAAIAEKFGGGGHFHAAGAHLRGNFEESKKKVIHELNLALQELELRSIKNVEYEGNFF